MRAVEGAAATPERASGTRPPRRRAAARLDRTWRIGRIGGTDIEVAASLLVAVVLLSVAAAPFAGDLRPGLGLWAYGIGVVLTVVLYLAVLVHELAHVALARRWGHDVPTVTLNLMGGVTAVDGEARTPREEAVTAGVGPLASLALGGLFWWLTALLPDRGLATYVAGTLAWSNLGLGLLNLVPALPLDGGRVLKALVWAVGGSPHRGTLVAAGAARVGAVALLIWVVGAGIAWDPALPVLDAVVVLAAAVFLWSAAGAELRSARLRLRFAGLRLADVVRRAVTVPDDLDVDQARDVARAAGARAIVTLDERGAPRGIVPAAEATEVTETTETTQATVPTAPSVPVGLGARSLQSTTSIDLDTTGDDLLAAISADPAPDYLVTEHGRIVAVLLLSDLDRALPG